MKIKERKVIWENNDYRIIKIVPQYPMDGVRFVVEESFLDALEVRSFRKISEIEQDAKVFFAVLSSLEAKS